MGNSKPDSLKDDFANERRDASGAFRLFFDQAAGGLAVIDLDGICKRVNPAFCRMIGYEEDEIVGKSILEFTHPDDRVKTMDDRDVALNKNKNKTNRTEKRYLHKDGHIVWGVVDRAVAVDGDGTPLHTIGQIQDITELKRTQESLRKIEDFHNRAIAGANDGLWEINLKTGKVYRSPRWSLMFGYEVGEISDTRDGFLNIVHPDDVENLAETQRNHIENNTPIDFELRVRHKKGHWVHVHSRGQMTPDENGEPWYLSGSNIDITSQIAAKNALQASEERFRDFVSAAADRFWEMDDQYRFTYISQLKENSERLAVNTMIGKARWEVPGVDLEDETWKAHRADLEAHRPYQNFVYQSQIANGETVWMQSSGVPVFDSHGTFTGYRGTNLEITSEVEAAKARDVSEEKFRALFEMAGDAIMVSDPTTFKFIEVNKLAAEQRGYSVDELVGMNIRDINKVFDAELAQGLRDELARVGEITYETEHKRKDGSSFPVEIRSRLMEIDGKNVVSAIVRDITERREVDRLKDEFVSTVSHELRTPLTSIKGALGIIQSGIGGKISEQISSMLEIALRNCERLILLIGDILDMEKIEAGKVDYDMGTVDVRVLVADALEANKGYGEQYGVTIIFDAPEVGMDFLVEGDDARLMQVLSNLISNAAKFSPKGADIKISVVRKEEMVRISVSDQGPGIPVRSQSQIFQKFFQADGSSTREKGGTGLGLSISKAIVEHHNGSIDFDTKVGKGTTFYFDLPVAD
jgi:PAS domain S-box-containing protein